MKRSTESIVVRMLVAMFLFAACIPSSFGDVPSIPANFAAAAPLDSQVGLSWTAVSGATGYNAYRATVPGSETLLQGNIASTTFEDSGLSNGVTYYYMVTAVNGSGESGKSAEVSVVTKASPAANLSATAGDSQVVLKWNASPTASSYRVYRDTLGGAGGATNFLVTSTNYTDTGLVNGTRYFYQVGTINISGENPGTGSTVSATPTAGNSREAPAGAPSGVTATAGNSVVVLNWLPVSNASTYDVFRGFDSNTETSWHTGVVATAFSDTGLSNGLACYYKVRAANAGQFSGLSSEVTATPHLPAAPTNLTARAGSRQIVLTWAGDGTSYAVYRGIASGSETLLNSGLVGSAFTDAGVANGTPYFYKIQCLNNGGSSPLSAEISATPSGAASQSWSGTVGFSLPGEPVQSCAASIPDTNRPVQLALLSAEGTNMQALAQKYNAITLALDGFTAFNFGTPSNPRYLSTVSDSHQVSIMDCRWPQLSAQRIQAALTAAARMVPSHPEIENAGLVLYGFSEGADNVNLTASQPALVNRVLAVVHLSEIDEDRYNPLVVMDTVPHLFLASGLSDTFSTLNLGMEDFLAVTHDAFARGLAATQGAPLTVLNNVGVGHGGNPDHPFISLWLDAVLSQRLPATVPVSAAANLPGWQGCSSWAGSYDLASNSIAPWNSGVQTINNVIAAQSAYSDSRPFTWLPGRNTAIAWLGYANSGAMTAFNPVITSPTTAMATVGKLFSFEITAINGPVSYRASGLPDGFSLDPAAGIIRGTPTVSGVFSITITATNNIGSATATLTLTALKPFSIRNVSLDPASGSLSMQYDTSSGQGYTLQASTNLLGCWISVSNLTATGNTTTSLLSKLLLDSALGNSSRSQTFIRISAP